jgi:hypothetical protein
MSDPSRAGCQAVVDTGRRHAQAWRECFGYGFRDALRLAARELGPEAWPTLRELAEQYDLAGPS